MDTRHDTSAPGRLPTPSALLLGCALATGILLIGQGTHPERPPQPSAAQAFPSQSPTTTAPALAPATAPPSTAPASASASTPALPSPAEPETLRPLPPSDPVRLRIPAIGVDAPMTGLDLDAAGALQPPSADSPNLTGWYRGGASPGSSGTAIATGHVDTRSGPAVFFRLGALPKGSTVEVTRADGSTAVFTVDAVEVYDKKAFPDDKVYGNTSGLPELRVITCGGGYTKPTGYLGNVVVYATLTGTEWLGRR